MLLTLLLLYPELAEQDGLCRRWWMTEKECWITRRASNLATAIQIKPHDVGKNTRLIMSWHLYMPYCKEAFLSERQPSAVNAGSRERENEKKKISFILPCSMCIYGVCSFCLSVLFCLFNVCLCFFFKVHIISFHSSYFNFFKYVHSFTFIPLSPSVWTEILSISSFIWMVHLLEQSIIQNNQDGQNLP